VPWLPAIAAAAIILRAWIEWRAHRSAKVVERVDSLRILVARSEGTAFKRRLPPWLPAILISFLFTLLSAGYISSALVGLVVLLVISAMLIARVSLLPRLRAWMAWTKLMNRVPLVVRLGAAFAATYFLAILITANGLNGAAGAFGAQLVGMALGLLVMIILTGTGEPVPAPGAAVRNRFLPATLPPGAWRRVGQIGMGLFFLVLIPVRLYAECRDPKCCFVTPGLAAGGVSAQLGFGFLSLGFDVGLPRLELALYQYWWSFLSLCAGHNPFDVETDNAVLGVRG
jgi:hypothetical protein